MNGKRRRFIRQTPNRSVARYWSIQRSEQDPWYERLMERRAYKEGLEDWFNASYLSLMKDKGTEVQSRVKAIIAMA